MRLCPASFLPLLGVAFVLACGDGTPPKVAEDSRGGSTGFFSDSASGGGAMGGSSGRTSAGGTPAGGSTYIGLGGTLGTGSGTSVNPDPTGGSGGASTPSGGRSTGGGTGSGATGTGGRGSGGTVSGGTGPGGTSFGGTATGGRISGGAGVGGRTSGAGSGGSASGGTAGSRGGSGGSSGSSTGGTTGSGPTDLPNVSNGQQGWSTRYWDCCKPSCGWSEKSSRPVPACDNNNQSLGNNFSAQSACSGGNAHTCWNLAPWSVSSNVAYGFAAFNDAACGTCYQLDFSGTSHNGNTDAGSQSLSGKHMIVRVINTGGIQSGQFDLLVPGGGVGDFNACSAQWGTSDLGQQYGGFFLSCAQQNNYDYEPSRTCARNWCQKVFSSKQDLLDGCLWYVEWAGMADNPNLTYGQVSCPSELTAISGG